jgi:hypothetical protein
MDERPGGAEAMANGDEPRRREGRREYRAEDQADKEQAKAIEAVIKDVYAGSAGDVPRTPDELIEFARLTALAKGKAMLGEQIEVLDGEIVARCSYARVWAGDYGAAGFGWEEWGRKTYVLESLLSFLQRLDADPEARDYLAKRFRREVIRNAKGDADGGKIPVDNSGDPKAA